MQGEAATCKALLEKVGEFSTAITPMKERTEAILELITTKNFSEVGLAMVLGPAQRLAKNLDELLAEIPKLTKELEEFAGPSGR